MSGRHEHSELLIDVKDLTSNPMQYFRERPTAVHSEGKVLGYAIGVELFEQMMKTIGDFEEDRAIRSQFRPSAERLREIRQRSAEALDRNLESNRNNPGAK
ncbi:MAG: hypothetical protein Marn2KO_15290 [Marinobacter nauticus]